MKLSPCGIDCETCTIEDCDSCHAIEGKPFYLADFDLSVCPLFDCPVNQKGYTTCAECSELPCQLYYDWRDPSMSDEEHEQSIGVRVQLLKDSLNS